MPVWGNVLIYAFCIRDVDFGGMLLCHFNDKTIHLHLSIFTIKIECILKAQVPGVSMRPPLCTDADDLLSCSATVENLGERGEPHILT